ncbi:hypothetical protein CPLU01_13504 [Colletotrichum plurivorum]|uniref:Uncharacterized protein n=1 Tax=Colletotrichum plurivorum TaxID=2175906 RepID=A0A8H6N2B3_9PEZI|nr:hypothetical protein CPLU01_13504 [Colletotrichum plurivorum]
MATLSPESAAGAQGPDRLASSTLQWPFNSACFDQVLFRTTKQLDFDFCMIDALPRLPSLTYLCLSAASKLTLGNEATSAATSKRNDGRLRISSKAFRLLLSSFNVPVAFAAALARPYMVCGTGFRQVSPQAWDHWCLIPVRTVTPCKVQAKEHTKSTAGSNQLDPFHYIHLSGAKADIRGSYIGLFTQHAPGRGGTTVVLFSLLDPRLRDLIEEPLNRVRAAVRRASGTGVDINPHFVHLVYLSSALRWWNNVLLCFNQELVMHEKQLQNETAADTSAFSLRSKDINTSLHTMAAHLHRYKSELHRVDSILRELQSAKFSTGDEVGNAESNMPQDSLKIDHLMSQLNAIRSFSDELERKVQNILALLFNQIQVTNDRTLQAILTAAQEDNKLSQNIVLQSHELAKRTSFAAIFAMPFFNENEYMKAPAQVWIWTVVTVVSTLFAFAIFARIIRRQTKGDEESGEGGGIPLSTQLPSAVVATTP